MFLLLPVRKLRLLVIISLWRAFLGLLLCARKQGGQGGHSGEPCGHILLP